MAINPKDSIPPPLIGKIGPYTVFMTPPSDPAPDSPKKPVLSSPPPVQPPPHQFEKSASAENGSIAGFFRNAATKLQNDWSFEALSGNGWHDIQLSRGWISRLFCSRRAALTPKPSRSRMMCNALTDDTNQAQRKPIGSASVTSWRNGNSQHMIFTLDSKAHSSLDDHLARWFGLNQSKYQWAVDDYYSNKGLEKESGKAKDVPTKLQNV